MAIDVRTTPDALVVEAALPGVKPEDVDISILGDTLTISGRTSQETSNDEDGYTYREIRRGSFSRTLTLPRGVKSDAAQARFDNGMLELTIPKAEEAKPRQIKISPMTQGQAAQVGGGQVSNEDDK
jgi:HSP20 family protein